MRVRARFAVSSGSDPDLHNPGTSFQGPCIYSPGTVGDGSFDARETPSFQALDRLVGGFRASFPAHLRNPVQDEMIDAYSYAASCAGHL